MIVTAALVWCNELPEDLDRCIRSTAVIADRVVALDGGYRRYPNAMVRSPDDQVEAIREAAKAVGIECLILQPDRLWAGQVEKRSHLMMNASVGSDWVAIVDADWVISGDRDSARAYLESTDFDLVAAYFRTPRNESVIPSDRAAHIWHLEMIGSTVQMGHVFNVKRLVGLHVEDAHWYYKACKNGQDIWVWGHRGSVPQGLIPDPYIIDHMTFFRTEEQIRASRAFLNDREKVMALTGQEDDIPGLFEPSFDYEKLPYN